LKELGEPIGADETAQLVALIEQVYRSVPAKREVTAADFSMDELPPGRIVVREVELKWSGERLRVGNTLEDARPPFEWIYEVSSDVGEADYFKHYLVRAHDIVLAQRKVLTPLDAEEAGVLRGDLDAALKFLGF
jgi:hypothetical protein